MPRHDPPPNSRIVSPQRTSHALRNGLSRHQLASKRVEHPIHGVVAPAGSTSDLADRCRAIAVGLPEQHAFSHVTAAALLGLPLPLGIDTDDIHVSVPAGFIVPDHHHLTCHGLWLPADHVRVVLGVKCLSAARCFLDLATMLRYEQLVALGDHAIRQALTTPDELASLISIASRRRGVVAARRAVDLLDPRAESPPESVTRVWLVEAGLPEITPQAVIRDSLGAFVARVDLCIEEFMIVIEYQGAYHRDAAIFAADIQRRRRLRALGYLVVEIEADQLRNRLGVVLAVVEALRERGWSGTPRHPLR
jgi:hypothetical protein